LLTGILKTSLEPVEYQAYLTLVYGHGLIIAERHVEGDSTNAFAGQYPYIEGTFSIRKARPIILPKARPTLLKGMLISKVSSGGGFCSKAKLGTPDQSGWVTLQSFQIS
jgi:hypothetical protein